MGILSIFRPMRQTKTQQWQELGGYSATFSAFGGDIYKSALVRSCIRPLAEFSSKASARCSDAKLERMLNNRPNLYMNGHDFLYKVRSRLELTNTVMIYISRDDRGKVAALYPVPYQRFEAIEYQNGLFLKFYFNGEREPLTVAWQDLAVLRKDYNASDIVGDRNAAILSTLEMLQTTDEGAANAIKATANLRGILKSTKAMLAAEDIKKQKEQFVKDYLNLENEGGIASLDATQEFTPIQMSPLVASYEQRKEYREDVFRYFGVNDKIITSDMTSAEIEAFYELKIEPFLVKLSKELTSKIWQGKELAFDNWLVYEANKLQFVSMEKKISLFKEVVLYGGMTINEWRDGCNMAPIEGGDTPIRRLDAAEVGGTDENDEE